VTATGPPGSVRIHPGQSGSAWIRPGQSGSARGQSGSAWVSPGPPGPPGTWRTSRGKFLTRGVHDEAASFDATDWRQIVSLYDLLLHRWPSPVVALNRAVAVGFADGPAAGLAAAGSAQAAEARLPTGGLC